MNKLIELFKNKERDILNIYFTAGYPKLDSTGHILKRLDQNKVDIIEIGMPYSDPLADGPTIQASGAKALENGMHLDLLFQQIDSIRPSLKHASLILMGYYNQVLQFGPQKFFRQCKAVGIDGLILPDLPLHEYESEYKDLFDELDLGISFLITPQTPDTRIKKIDKLSKGFIYMVSSASITGAQKEVNDIQLDYYKRINALELNNPRLIGFGISDNKSFKTACQYAQGAIIGSAFIRALSDAQNLELGIDNFVKNIRVSDLEAKSI